MKTLTVGQRAIALGVLLVLTTFAYRGVIANGFVYDDAVTVTKNPAVRSVVRAPEWIVSPHASSANRGGKNFRPVTVASYGIDYGLWGERAAGFHATNLAIHLVVVFLVFLAALRLWTAELAGLTAAAWMALHPMNAQAVNYITARSSTLAAAFTLAAVVLYDRWAAPRAAAGPGPAAWGWMAGALVCGLMALGAKESAAVLPLLIVAWDRARFGAGTRWRASLVRSAPFWGLLAGWLVLRQIVVGAGPDRGEMPWSWAIQSGAFAAKIVNSTVAHSLWPVGFAVDYGWPISLTSGTMIASIAGTVGLIAAGWALTRVDRRMAWCAAWFGAALLPVLALPLVTRLALYQEHRAYLAQIGFAWLAGGAAWWVWSRWSGERWARRIVATLAVVLVIGMVGLDAERTRVWRDPVSLWEDVLTKYPHSAIARGERGTWLVSSGRFDEAEQEFLSALSAMPNYVYLHLMLGVVYAKRGEFDRAVAALQTALEFRPAFIEARIRLGLAYERLGQTDRALAEYDRAIRDDPWASPALLFSALILAEQGRRQEALERLHRVDPGDPIYQDVRAVIDRLGDSRAQGADLGGPP
jgi:tetratricopeptide (TPR) repeat protein